MMALIWDGLLQRLSDMAVCLTSGSWAGNPYPPRRSWTWEVMMSEALPALMTLSDVLERLKGIVGRTFILQHLKEHPEHKGKPTHRRIGRRIIVYAEDFPRLLESLECRSKSSNAQAVKRSMCAEPSADRAYMKAQELITKSRQRLTEQREKRNSGKRVSMVSAQ